MKILIVTDLFVPNVGGLEFTVERLAWQFQKRGHQVCVVAARNPPNLPAFEMVKGIPTHRLFFIRPQPHPKFLLGLPSFIFLKNIIQKEKPDIIQVHFPHSNGLSSLLASFFTSIPLVVTMHGSDAQVFPKKSAIERAITTNLFKRARAITGISQFTTRCATELLPTQHEKFSAITSGIDVEEYDKSNEAYRHKDEKTYIYSTGRFVYKKGFDILINAFAKIAQAFPEVDLIISGDGPEREKCQKKIKEFGLSGRIFLPGFVSRPDMIRYFKGCAFFCIPSRQEPLGATVLEAMACGKAVAASKVDGIVEMVEEGRTGFFFSPGDSEDCAKILSKMLKDNTLCEKMGKAGREKVVSFFTWSRAADEYLQLFEKVLKV
ncbi:hypothetical protein AUJ17_04965 [Candidatus Micrarchaeota archaeon CG1_02_47_40]|nr:MAG: hypothetical protein AUJ17_04965 [Candidatus Micrarchaeota archaeon CG1_02_47_40]